MTKFRELDIVQRRTHLGISDMPTEAPLPIPDENYVYKLEHWVGVVEGLMIDGTRHNVPLCIEEPTVIAAVQKAAKLYKFHTEVFHGGLTYGQIIRPKFAPTWPLVHDAISAISSHAVLREMFKTGDGNWVLGIDTSDAQGGFMVTRICERLSVLLDGCGGIVSNHHGYRTCKVWTTVSFDRGNLKLRERALSIWSDTGPYRQPTMCKGIMNAMFALLQATGNDTRALAAAMMSMPPRIECETHGTDVTVRLVTPVSGGTVGGYTGAPSSKVAFSILRAPELWTLHRILACVGLAANISATMCIASDGVAAAHTRMKKGG